MSRRLRSAHVIPFLALPRFRCATRRACVGRNEQLSRAAVRRDSPRSCRPMGGRGRHGRVSGGRDVCAVKHSGRRQVSADLTPALSAHREAAGSQGDRRSLGSIGDGSPPVRTARRGPCGGHGRVGLRRLTRRRQDRDGRRGRSGRGNGQDSASRRHYRPAGARTAARDRDDQGRGRRCGDQAAGFRRLARVRRL